MDMIFTSLDYFLRIVGNVCETFFNLLTYEVSFPVLGQFWINVKLGDALLGGGLIALILYKLAMWIAPVV